MSITDKAAVVEFSAFMANSGKSKRVSVEARDFYSLSYRYSGKVLIKTADATLVSKDSSITFMPKNIEYETEILKDTQMAVVHFRLNRDIDFRNPSVLEVNDEEVYILFEKLIKSFKVDAVIDFSSMAIFYELLARLELLGEFRGGNYIPKKIQLAREYMLESFTDPFFSVGTLARRLGVSSSYLRREFSSVYKKSPVVFLRDVRISHAKNLLQSEYLTIEEIAHQSGFSSSSYFIQVFRKCLGTSPDRYRQKL